MIVFNKPAGIAKSPPAASSPLPTSNTSAPIYFESLIPELLKIFTQFKDLHIVKFPERYTSGVTILSGSEEVAQRINKCKKRAKTMDECNDSHLVISLGHPLTKHSQGKYAVKLAKGEVNNRKVPILEDRWSEMDRKRQRVKLVRISHKLVRKGSEASLCRVSSSTTAHNALRLFFATKLLSPILGDNTFSARVNNVMGVPMLLDPWSDVANSTKVCYNYCTYFLV